jgi:ribosome-associated translation inhibitor RaiA
MQIQIRVSRPSAAITDQIRAYAEYRIFSAIGDKAPDVRRVVINLAVHERPRGRMSATCTVSARLLGRMVRTGARSTHPAAAIDQAAAWLTEAIGVELADGAAITRER